MLFSLNQQRRFLAGVLASIAAIWIWAPAQANMQIGAEAAKFRMIELNGWRGLPRIGLQDTGGIAPYPTRHPTAQQRANADPALARRLSAQMERHNLSLRLLPHLAFLRANPDCSAGAEQFAPSIERCQGFPLMPDQRRFAADDFMRTLALSLKPEQHAATFCLSADGCGVDTIWQITKKLPNGRVQNLDEFELREKHAAIVQDHFADFRRYYADKAMPDQAWFVAASALGAYDFDLGKFSLRLTGPERAMMRQEVPAPRDSSPTPARPKGATTPRINPVEFVHQPTQQFEKAAKTPSPGMPFLHQPVDLAMTPEAARNLVNSMPQGARYVYTVVKIGFAPWKGSGRSYGEVSLDSRKQPFYFAENKVEFYRDEALTEKLGEAPLVAVAATDRQATASSPTDLFQAPPESRIFDTRAFHLLRFPLGTLSPHDRDRMAFMIAENERLFWQQLEVRERTAAQTQPAGGTLQQQQQAKARQQAANNAAQSKSFAWTEAATWPAAQRQAFMDYLLGYGASPEGKDGSPWPDALAAVDWGMNVATVFPRGHFPTDPAMVGIRADDASLGTLEAFAKALAAHYPTQQLTGVYDLGTPRYDQKTGELSFENWPFSALPDNPPVQFTTAPQTGFRGVTYTLAHPDAKSRMLYRMALSTASLGTLRPDHYISRCTHSSRRKSMDCGTYWGAFMPVETHSALFALDRQITPPSLRFSPTQGLAHAQARDGWRLVVEFSDISMRLIPYQYTLAGSGDPRETEAQTVLASIERVAIIAPDDRLIWSADGASLPAAADLTETVAPEAARTEYAFPDVVALGADSQLQAAAYDFLLAKYQPQRLSERMLDAMMSSRWVYERNATAPLGGRFFNATARQPSADDTAANRPQFKTWLLNQAKAFPNRLAVDLSLQYTATSMAVSGRCLRANAVPGAPIRSNTPIMLAQQQQRQCQMAHDQALNAHQRCQDISAEVAAAKSALAKAEAAGCTAAAATTTAQPSTPEAGAGCRISPDVAPSQLGQEMQRCILQQCGGQPTTLAEIQQFQTCVQAAQADLTAQVQAILSGQAPAPNGGGPSKAAGQGNHCKAAQSRLYQAEQNYRSARCETHAQAPTPPDCDFLSKVQQPDFMPIQNIEALNDKQCAADQAFYRKQNHAAALLPGGRAYGDTNLALSLDVGGALELPYDPPPGHGNPGRPVIAKLILEIQGAATPGDAGSVDLIAKPVSVDYAPFQP
ncbi:MAG: hypothetical protein Tsb0016_00590 [Sphingomonadales bacterium]